MNSKSAYLYASGHCEGSPWPDEPRVAKAVKFAAHHEELAFLLERQRALDLEVQRALKKITLPPEIVASVAARAADAEKRGLKRGLASQWTQPAVLAPLCGLLLIVGIVVFLAVLKANNFPGMPAAQEMLETAQGMTGNELEAVSKKGSEMGDWWFLKSGLEDFGLNGEFADTHVIGCRLLKQDGHPVAQMAAEPNLLIHVFRAADFGIQLAAPGWHIFEQDGWVAAIRPIGSMCQMVAFPGDRGKMETFLKRLARKAAATPAR